MATKVNDIRGQRIVVGLVPALYDKVTVTYPDSVTQVYTFLLEGITLGVVTLVTDVSGNLISAERTT